MESLKRHASSSLTSVVVSTGQVVALDPQRLPAEVVAGAFDAHHASIANIGPSDKRV